MPPARIALWVASLAGMALLARTLVLDPVPTWLAVAALGGYLAFALVGALVPRLEMYGDVFWRGAAGKEGVALTFDDGPHPRTTRAILEILEEADVRATFFVVGAKARLHPDVIREIHDAGHVLGVHGWDHDRLYAFKPPRAVVDDIRRCQRAVEDACGVRPRLFRPPVGQSSPRTHAGARRADVTLVGWTVRGLDGVASADPDAVARRVERRVGQGSIVLLHDAAERDDHEPAALRALPRILDALRRRGLAVVPLDDLGASA